MRKRRGVMYRKRVAEVNRVYDKYAKMGVSNIEIWRKYISPVYGMSERTYYRTLNAAARVGESAAAFEAMPRLFNLSDKDNDIKTKSDG